jgi:hypothetical protein
MSILSRDFRHCLASDSCRDNDVHPNPFRTAAKVRDRATVLVVPVRAGHSTLEHAGKDIG